MAYAWRVELDGVDITAQVTGFTVSCRQESFCRELTFGLADLALYDSLDFSILPDAARVEVFTGIGAGLISQGRYFIERPALLVDRDRNLADGIWGRQETALLGEPFASKITRAWSANTSIFAILQELCALVGVDFAQDACEIGDYTLFANTYQADGLYPSQIISELAQLCCAWPASTAAGGMALKATRYAPGAHDRDLIDGDVQSISETWEWPQFGNRVKITPIGGAGGLSITLGVPHPCLPADGETRTRLIARVLDSDGNPLTGQPVTFSTGTALASLSATVANTRDYLISGEHLRAESRTRLTLAYPPAEVLAIRPYADRTVNFVGGGYSVDGNTVLLTVPMPYCDQSVVVDYLVAGVAVTYLVAGASAEDVTVTADVEGQRASAQVYVDNPCQCGATITVEAIPSSIEVGNQSQILVSVEETGGPVESGRLVFLAETSRPRRGHLSWEVGRLGAASVTNVRLAAKNDVAGVTQTDLPHWVSRVIGIWQADENGDATGPNLYASHHSKVADLSMSLTTGTALVGSYVAQGVAVALYQGVVPGTATISAWLQSAREQYAQASCSVMISAPDSGLPSIPDGWEPEDWDNIVDDWESGDWDGGEWEDDVQDPPEESCTEVFDEQACGAHLVLYDHGEEGSSGVAGKVGAAPSHAGCIIWIADAEGGLSADEYVQMAVGGPWQEGGTITLQEAQSVEEWVYGFTRCGDHNGEDGDPGDSGIDNDDDIEICDGTRCNTSHGRECCTKDGEIGCWPSEECDEDQDCRPRNVGGATDEATLEGRFADVRQTGCDCDEMCDAEFEQYNTTQGYDGGSMRSIDQILRADYGLERVEGGDNAAYEERRDEIRRAMLANCHEQCDECDSAAPLAWSAGVVGFVPPGGQTSLQSTGGLEPFEASVDNGAWSVQLSGSTVIVGSPSGCANGNAANVTLRDKCGAQISMSVMCAAYYYADDGWYIADGPYNECYLYYHRTVYSTTSGAATDSLWCWGDLNPFKDAAGGSFAGDCSDAQSRTGAPNIKIRHCRYCGYNDLCQPVNDPANPCKDWQLGAKNFHPGAGIGLCP